MLLKPAQFLPEIARKDSITHVTLTGKREQKYKHVSRDPGIV